MLIPARRQGLFLIVMMPLISSIAFAGEGEKAKKEAPIIPGETKMAVVGQEKGAAAGKSGRAGANSIGARMIKIHAGSFLMGSTMSDPNKTTGETQHRVKLTKGFLLGATEVTQGQWQAVMGSNPSKFSSCGSDCPVEQVSWIDAVEFCNILSDKEGLTRCYSGAEWDRGCTGYRLPTEAEWEYAARAGTSTRFSTGICLSTDQANYNGNYPVDLNWNYPPDMCAKGQYREKTIQCGSFAANSRGLRDMHGNVAEWVWDWHQKDFPSGTATNPVGPSSGSYRVFRGGSWEDGAAQARSAHRACAEPDRRFPGLGFRLSRSLL